MGFLKSLFKSVVSNINPSTLSNVYQLGSKINESLVLGKKIYDNVKMGMKEAPNKIIQGAGQLASDYINQGINQGSQIANQYLNQGINQINQGINQGSQIINQMTNQMNQMQGRFTTQPVSDYKSYWG